jgi:hypothetical protein
MNLNNRRDRTLDKAANAATENRFLSNLRSHQSSELQVVSLSSADRCYACWAKLNSPESSTYPSLSLKVMRKTIATDVPSIEAWKNQVSGRFT